MAEFNKIFSIQKSSNCTTGCHGSAHWQ